MTPIFRGATKPAMFMGAPLVPLCAVIIPMFSVIFFVNTLTVVIAVVGVCVFAWAIMRDITKRDDQYLNMLLLELKERGMFRKNRHKTVFYIPPRKLRINKMEL